MKKNVVYVGVDVDDKAFHFSCVTDDGFSIAKGVRALPSAGKLLKSIKKLLGDVQFIIGYEATYLGFSLARELEALGGNCLVISPTSIKRAINERVKNDSLDSYKLAHGMQKQEFSYVKVPTKAQEADRQMVRTRAFLVAQQSDTKRHIISQCRLFGLDFKQETKSKSFWTRTHRAWLDKKITSLEPSMQLCISCLLQQLESLEARVASLDREIELLMTKSHYEKPAQALQAFKGISKISAMTIITEIIDINRFRHPKQLVAFCGLDIREYSSGGKQTQYGITKMGNRRLRTCLVEACQKFSTSQTPSKRKMVFRRGVDDKLTSIADRYQERIYTKGRRLLAREKNRNKVKVACAREMLGFIWEALREAA